MIRSPVGIRFSGGALLVTMLLLVSRCSSTLEPPSGDLYRDIRHRDPRIRVLAAKQAVAQDRRDLIPDLIENLSDRDGAVRMYSAIALRKLTGRDMGYLHFGAPQERQAAIEKWKEWLGAESAPPDETPLAGGRVNSSRGVMPPVPTDPEAPGHRQLDNSAAEAVTSPSGASSSESQGNATAEDEKRAKVEAGRGDT